MPVSTSNYPSPIDGFSWLARCTTSRVLVALILGLSPGAMPLVATAQSLQEAEPEGTEGPGSSLDLGTITVTGQKVKRSLADTDGSVTVVFPGNSDSTAGAASDLSGVAERLANVTPFAGGSSVAIRGIGQTGFVGVPTAGQTNYLATRGPGDLVATYMDGIPVSVYAAPFGFWDVDQIEVLRGAQSTLLGRGSLGGALVIENTDPTFTTEAAGQLALGTNSDQLATAFAVSGPILEDRLAYRIVFDRQTDPSFVDNITTGEEGDLKRRLTRRFKLLYVGEAGQDLELSTFFSNALIGTSYVDAGRWPDETVALPNVNTRLDNHSAGSSLRGSWPLSENLSLEMGTVWVQENAAQEFDVDTIQVPVSFADVDDDIRTLSQEVRLRYEVDDLFNGFLGAYFEDFQGQGSAFAMPFHQNRLIQQDIQTIALFGEGTWSLSEKTDLTLGLRFETEENNTTVNASPISNLGDIVIMNTVNERLAAAGPSTLPLHREPPRPTYSNLSDKNFSNFSVLLPKVGLSHKLSTTNRAYITVQQGYRAGGSGASLVSATPFVYNPEKTWNVDLGFRHTSSDGRLRLSTNLFYVDWRDQQLQVPAAVSLEPSPDTRAWLANVETATGQTITLPATTELPADNISVNAGQSVSYGLELDADYQATQRLRLFGSLGLLNTEIKESPEEEWIGNSFTMAPETTISAGWHYDLDSGLDISLVGHWRDKLFSDISNTSSEEVDSRLLFDLGIGYDFANARLDFKVTNLFDEKYLNHSYIRAVQNLGQTLAALNPDPRIAGPLRNVNGIVSPGDGRAVSLTMTSYF